MLFPKNRRDLWVLAAVTMLFILAAQAGYAVHGAYPAPVWPQAAVAAAAGVLYGPGSLFGAALYILWESISSHDAPATIQSALIRALATLIAATCCCLLARRMRFTGRLDTIRAVVRMMTLAVVFAVVNGVLFFFGDCHFSHEPVGVPLGWPNIWSYAMVGDIFGCLICMPALLSWGRWAEHPGPRRALPVAVERRRVPRLPRASMAALGPNFVPTPRTGSLRLSRAQVVFMIVCAIVGLVSWKAAQFGTLYAYIIGYVALPLLAWAATKFPPLFVHSAICVGSLATITVQVLAEGKMETRPLVAAIADVNIHPLVYTAGVFLFLQSVSTLTLIVNVVIQQQQRLSNELAFRTQQARVELMLHTATDAVISFDDHGALTYWNPAAERLFGRSAAEAIGRPVFEVLPLPKLFPGVSEGIAALCDAGDELFSGAVIEFDARHIDGRPLPVELSLTSYRNERGWAATAFMRDARAHKRQEEALRLARDKAEEATRAKSLFLATMSHELRTPLSGVIGMLQLGLREVMPAQARSRVSLALGNAEALLAIINDVLDFSKIEAGKMVFESVDFDLRDMLHSLVELLDLRAQEQGLSLLSYVDPNVPRWLRSDPVRLRQILLNLIGNALKFTEAGTVCVRVECDACADGRLLLRFEVEDTGIGISESAQQRLFSSFEQADVTTTRKFGGTGLGLTITRRLVDGMKGEISLRSVPGQGSTFQVSIPMLPGEPVRPSLEEAVCAFECRLNVLCAEDGHTNRVIVQAFVQGLGHDVTFVENGLLAVQRCAQEPFDLVLMDGRMPVMDGLTAARAIRAGGVDTMQVLDPDIWIIALTANATGNDRALSLAAGMNDFLAKPVDERQLGRALHRAADALRARGRVLRQASPNGPTDKASLAVLDAMMMDTTDAEDDSEFESVEINALAPVAAGAATLSRPSVSALAVGVPVRSLADRLRDAFRTETPRLLADLTDALAQRDWVRAARIAHNIKGSAFYIQCEAMADHAGALENACDVGQYDDVEMHWINLQGSIETWIKQN